MSTFVGSVVTRLHLAEPYVPDDFAGTLRECVEAHVFTDYPSSTSQGVRSGFATTGSPLVLPVDVADTARWISTPYVTLCWRIDDKKVPPKKLKARCQELEGAWARANQREKCPRAVKAELKEAAEMEMLPRCMPTSKIVSIVWHALDGWMVFSTQSAAHLDLIRKLVHRAFGITLTPTAPDDGLDAETLAALAATRPLVLGSCREPTRESRQDADAG